MCLQIYCKFYSLYTHLLQLLNESKIDIRYTCIVKMYLFTNVSGFELYFYYLYMFLEQKID